MSKSVQCAGNVVLGVKAKAFSLGISKAFSLGISDKIGERSLFCKNKKKWKSVCYYLYYY